MLTITNLEKSYGSQVLFNDTGFALGRGERVGLVGRNGSGKTTLFKLILGREHQDSGTISMPSGYRMAHLEQHISFTRARVIDEAATALPPNEDGIDETYKAESILMGLGFDADLLRAHPESLSGGYQVRLNLAKALVSSPDLLLLDEPTNYLDIISIRWLTGFLRSWPGEFMLITHDRAFMDNVTTHTVGINRGKLIKVEGGSGKLYNRILMEEEHHESQRLNDDRKRKEAEKFINRFRAQATRASAVQSRIKQVGKMQKREKLPVEKDLDFSFRDLPFTGKQMLEADGLTFGFKGTPVLINDLSMTVRKGDRIAVVGRNGAGKTTLLNLLAGELSPQSGKISMHAKTSIAYFGQTNVMRLHPQKTVEQEIMDSDSSIGQKVARNIAGAMMFEGDSALKKVNVLSGGERARVLLGRILAQPANLLLLDEPTNHLDAESVDSLLAAIDNFQGAVIIVTHSEMVLDIVADKLIVFDGPRPWLYDGTYRDFLTKHGFASEGDRNLSAAKRTASDAAGTAAPVDRKEAKRMRAELINERSRTLTPLKASIEYTEASIFEMEADVETYETELIAASGIGDAARIATLSKGMHETQQKINEMFNELEKQSEQYDQLSMEFDKRFNELPPT